MIAAKLIQDFTSRFESPPAYVVRAPGRVNLIGEHTDYNQGLAMPMAIDLAMLMVLGPRDDSQVRIHSQNFDAGVQFDLSQLDHAESGWGEYAEGVAWALIEHGYALKGWEAALASEIPVGAGLSSSAAFEMACVKAF